MIHMDCPVAVSSRRMGVPLVRRDEAVAAPHGGACWIRPTCCLASFRCVPLVSVLLHLLSALPSLSLRILWLHRGTCQLALRAGHSRPETGLARGLWVGEAAVPSWPLPLWMPPLPAQLAKGIWQLLGSGQ